MLRVLSSEEISLIAGGLEVEPGIDPDGGGGGFADSGDYVGDNGFNVDNNTGNNIDQNGDIVVQATWSQVIDAWASYDSFSKADLSHLADTFDHIADGFGNAAEVGGVVTTASGLAAAGQLGVDIPNDLVFAASGTATAAMAVGHLMFHGLAGAARAAAQ